jgi:hypothetical protein
MGHARYDIRRRGFEMRKRLSLCMLALFIFSGAAMAANLRPRVRTLTIFSAAAPEACRDGTVLANVNGTFSWSNDCSEWSAFPGLGNPNNWTDANTFSGGAILANTGGAVQNAYAGRLQLGATNPGYVEVHYVESIMKGTACPVSPAIALWKEDGGGGRGFYVCGASGIWEEIQTLVTTYNTEGNGAPVGNCITGSLYHRMDGGTDTSLYVCESTLWVAK